MGGLGTEAWEYVVAREVSFEVEVCRVPREANPSDVLTRSVSHPVMEKQLARFNVARGRLTKGCGGECSFAVASLERSRRVKADRGESPFEAVDTMMTVGRVKVISGERPFEARRPMTRRGGGGVKGNNGERPFEAVGPMTVVGRMMGAKRPGL